MAAIPNLAGVATQDLVEQIGGGNFKASYINWSRTMHLLREHAPGWMPQLVATTEGSMLHRAPVGAYLLICFVHADGSATPATPQAVMDSRNNAIPLDKITARDITDTHVRGICKAAALMFGLAYELWAKMPLESGYGDAPETVADDSPKTMPSNLTIGNDEFAELNRLLDDTATDKQAFCAHFQIASVAGLLMRDYAKAVAMLQAKLKKGAAQ